MTFNFFQIKFLLPKPILGLREIRPTKWATLVQADWAAAQPLSTHQAKAQVRDHTIIETREINECYVTCYVEYQIVGKCVSGI